MNCVETFTDFSLKFFQITFCARKVVAFFCEYERLARRVFSFPGQFHYVVNHWTSILSTNLQRNKNH